MPYVDFCFCCLCFWCHMQKYYCQNECQGASFLCFLLGVLWYQVFCLSFNSSWVNFCESYVSHSSSCSWFSFYLCVCARSFQSCLTLCDPMDCSLPVSSVREILQARILKWVAFPFSRGSSQPRDQTPIFCVSCVGRRFFNHWHPGKLLLFIGFSF